MQTDKITNREKVAQETEQGELDIIKLCFSPQQFENHFNGKRYKSALGASKLWHLGQSNMLPVLYVLWAKNGFRFLNDWPYWEKSKEEQHIMRY